MKVYHLDHKRWVERRVINRHITFASTHNDVVAMCVEDFAAMNNMYASDVKVDEYLYPPLVVCHNVAGTVSKVYQLRV